MVRHEIWRQRYRERPYLKNMDDATVRQRFLDIINNMTDINPEGQITPGPIDKVNVNLWEKFTHMLEEYGNRGGLPNDVPVSDNLPTPTYPDKPRLAESLQDLGLPENKEFFVKFGRTKHMEQMFNQGIVRVAPASSFDDPSLNPAIRDDENSVQLVFRRDEFLHHLKEFQDDIAHIPVSDDLVVTISFDQDYYIFCLTSSIDLRLPEDFQAEAGVVIYDTAEFRRRLNDAVSNMIPTFHPIDSPVNYVDPFFPKHSDLDIMFSKHFRYMYQKEHRFAWVTSRTNVSPLKEMFPRLGPLKDIAKILYLPEG